MSIKLEVGKKYRTRSGRLAEITATRDHNLNDFKYLATVDGESASGELGGVSTDSYREDGTWAIDAQEHRLDIVAEWDAPTQPAGDGGGFTASGTWTAPVEPQLDIRVTAGGGPKATGSVLTEAEAIVNGAREGQYGKAEDSFARIANLWNAFLANKGHGAPNEHILTPKDVADMMILLKLAREQHSHKRDNYVDAAGYAELANRIAEGG